MPNTNITEVLSNINNNFASEDIRISNKITYFQIVNSGVIAGCSEVIFNHPLWVIKTRIQCGHNPIWSLKGIYNGLFSNILSMVPLIAMRISFGTFIQNQLFSSNQELKPLHRIFSAFAGGCIPTLIGSPLEFTRTLQLKTKKNLFNTASDLINKNGIASLSVGMGGTATRDALYTCGFFALAPIIKAKVKTYCQNDWVSSVIAGPIAGAVAALSSQPFDTIKINQQVNPSTYNASIVKTAKTIYQKDGYMGFFKAATPRIMRVISGVTILSLVNEKASEYFYEKNISATSNNINPKARH